jgi:hypothetical protein
MKGGEMEKNFLSKCLVIMILLAVLLNACSGMSAAGSQPQPGVTLTGAISIKKADSGQITLEVSDDGQKIESISLQFTNIKCGGFSAGSTSSTTSVSAVITNGQFELEKSNFGKLSGLFTSPTEANGKIYLAFFEGKAECGTWNWSATVNK